MSVTFKDNSFTVEVQNCIDPAEAWLDTQKDLIDMIMSMDANVAINRFSYLELLRSMLPDEEMARKMLP